MGIYGHSFDRLMEGRTVVSDPLTISESTFGFASVVYDEYMNRCSLLESCEGNREILEAQIEVLREVSIKDIWNKVKEKVKEIFGKIKDFFVKIFDAIRFKGNNYTSYKDGKEAFEYAKDKKISIAASFYRFNPELKELINHGDVIYQLPLYLESFNFEKYVDNEGKEGARVGYSTAVGDAAKHTEKEVEDFFNTTIKYDKVLEAIDKNEKIPGSDYKKEYFDEFDSLEKNADDIYKTILKVESEYNDMLKKVEKYFSNANHLHNEPMKMTTLSINKDLANIQKLSSLYSKILMKAAQEKNNNIYALSNLGDKLNIQGAVFAGQFDNDGNEEDREDILKNKDYRDRRDIKRDYK